MAIRKRPAIWIMEGGLVAITILAMRWGWKEVAIAALAILGVMGNKLVESEEKGEPIKD